MDPDAKALDASDVPKEECLETATSYEHNKQLGEDRKVLTKPRAILGGMVFFLLVSSIGAYLLVRGGSEKPAKIYGPEIPSKQNKMPTNSKNAADGQPSVNSVSKNNIAFIVKSFSLQGLLLVALLPVVGVVIYGLKGKKKDKPLKLGTDHSIEQIKEGGRAEEQRAAEENSGQVEDIGKRQRNEKKGTTEELLWKVILIAFFVVMMLATFGGIIKAVVFWPIR